MLLPEISTPEGQTKNCKCRTLLALTSRKVPPFHLQPGGLPLRCLSKEHWALPLEDFSPVDSFSKAVMIFSIVSLAFLPEPFIHSEFFLEHLLYQDLSPFLKDAEMAQSLTTGWPLMATCRPELICGHFLANHFEVLMMGNDSFRAILNIQPFD